MSRILLLLSILLSSLNIAGKNTVVADALSRMPLPNASVFDRHGETIGICNAAGRDTIYPSTDYPVAIRHIGFTENPAETRRRHNIHAGKHHPIT